MELFMENSIFHKVCPDCRKPDSIILWCQQCNPKRFQQDFHKWTSGNKFIDKFIQESQLNASYLQVLEWIPYNRLANVEELAKGGFSTIFKAIWLDGPIKEWDYKKKQWNRISKYKNIEGYPVALKSLDNSLNLNEEFLNEWKNHYIGSTKTECFIKLFGITQDPETLNYVIIMNYASDGSLNKYLSDLIKFNWHTKMKLLSSIIRGLAELHKLNLVHSDLHDGNILMNGNLSSWISDLGLCKPVSYYSSTSRKLYGVVPYVAPEVLKEKPHTLASDIYSFSMIMWEFISGVRPFDDRAHDINLIISICKGERPKIPEITENIPECYINLMKRCWDSDPLKRPTAFEIRLLIDNWWMYSTKYYKDFTKENIDHEIIKENIDEIIEGIYWDEQLKNDIKEFWKADKALAQEQEQEQEHDASTLITATTLEISSNNSIRQPHPQAIYASRPLGHTQDLTENLKDLNF